MTKWTLPIYPESIGDARKRLDEQRSRGRSRERDPHSSTYSRNSSASSARSMIDERMEWANEERSRSASRPAPEPASPFTEASRYYSNPDETYDCDVLSPMAPPRPRKTCTREFAVEHNSIFKDIWRDYHQRQVVQMDRRLRILGQVPQKESLEHARTREASCQSFRVRIADHNRKLVGLDGLDVHMLPDAPPDKYELGPVIIPPLGDFRYTGTAVDLPMLVQQEETKSSETERTGAEAPETPHESPTIADAGEGSFKKPGNPQPWLRLQCSLCFKSFSRRTTLNTHQRSHTGDRPFPCPFPECTKSFALNNDKKRHEKTHRPEKPFRCGGTLPGGSPWGCGKKFARKDGLLEHHHKTVKGGQCLARWDAGLELGKDG